MPHPTGDEAETRAGEARGGRLSALIYDPFLWWGERAGMAEPRRALVSLARGSVLELGAGTGLNLEHYPDGLDRLLLAEPEPNMPKRLQQRRERLGRRAEIVRAAAEALPFADDSFRHGRLDHGPVHGAGTPLIPPSTSGASSGSSTRCF